MHKIIVRKGKTVYVEDLKRDVTVKKPKEYLADDDKDFHTEYGVVTKEELSGDEGIPIKKKGEEFLVFTASFLDMYKRMPRLAQIIPLKDIGSIILKTSLGPKSRVLDAGAGSGALSIILGKFAKEVYSYDIREDHLAIAKKNAKTFDINNIQFKLQDITKGIDETELDIITLDLPEPWDVSEHAEKALKVGGYICVYNPSIVQIQDFVNSLPKNFRLLEVIEVLERPWEVKGRKVRPKTQGIGHSGFLCFARKVQK